ncbi:uncharacterized protein (DUF2236 family) [Leucobacter komagatae]|uniref:Uncharacterized protein (DUF2236 family) n=1 Tax=Leucobacter komagatae TaxID=55969 RepID=A0A542Y6M0_9MICO|nr:uncharacterized protein (DUF2236 family) [Leucobacter komagatae]
MAISFIVVERASSASAKPPRKPDPVTDHTALPDSPPRSGYAPADGTDNGYFGPDSVSWRVFSDPAARLGIAAGILLQALNPLMMRLLAETAGGGSGLGASRPGQYLDTIIFGDRVHAEAAAEAVNALRADSAWTDPRTGMRLRGDNEEWRAWSHNALVYGLLRAAEAFGPELSRGEQDRFIVEQHTTACLLEIEDEAFLPATRAELEAYLERNSTWMALTIPAAELARDLRRPAAAVGPGEVDPVATWLSANLQDAILSLLPDWALLLYGTDGHSMRVSGAAKSTRTIVESARQNASVADTVAGVTSRVETHRYCPARGL